MAAKKSVPVESTRNAVADVARAYSQATSGYWTDCAKVLNDYVSELSDTKSTDNAAVKTARMYSRWAAAVQRSFEAYIDALPR